MKVVGLNIEKGRVAVSIVEKGLRRTELRDSSSRSFTTDAELVDVLKEMSRDWGGSRIVSSIPGRWFSQRTLTLPFNDPKRVEKALPFEIEDSVPFPLDDVVIEPLVLDRPEAVGDKKKESSVIGMMLPKTVLQRHLDLLATAGVDPQAIVPSYLGLSCLSRMVTVEGIAVLVAGTDLCVKKGPMVAACRSLAGPQATGGIRHTLKALETELGERFEKVHLLSANDELRAELAGLGISVEQISPDFNGKRVDDPVSLGLALCERPNFRSGAFAYRSADEGRRRKVRTLVIAGIIAAVLGVVNIGVKLYVVESGYGKLDREIREVYRQTFPDAKTVADPLRQLRARLDEAKKKYGALGTGSSALDVMKAVTEGIPKEVRVSFQEFSLEDERLKLSGEAASFDSVDKIKAELQKSRLFAEVTVLDTRMGVDNKVKFRFEMKLKQAM
ncbi:MAG TPA: type II secretion system protein GspL [Nitrospirota bacterium]